MQNKKLINGYSFMQYKKDGYDENTMQANASSYYTFMNERRSVRDFSNKPIPKTVIENIILTASTAPSGAHKQPWTFSNTNRSRKRRIRKL
jgi:iodotyrosine deiodinase